MSAGGDDSVLHEVTVNLDSQAGGASPAAWAGLAPPGEVRSLDALHHMLHEASVLSSHLRGYQGALNTYTTAADTFFDALTDFMASSGDPSLYENTLTPDGIKAAKAAAAAATAETGLLPPDASAAAGVHLAEATTTTTAASPAAATAATGSSAAAAGEGEGGSHMSESAFAPDAAVPRLPLLSHAAVVSPSGVQLCPGVPGTSSLGVKGGLTKVVPAELHLPAQHAALFSTESQRSLMSRGSSGLRVVLKDTLGPTLQLWLDTYEECKSMLPQVEHLRVAASKARDQLDAAKAAVVAAEASHPLVTPAALSQAGLAVPRVLVRGSEGTTLTHQPAGGTAAAAAAAGAAGGAGGGGGGDVVAVPAVDERREMYKKEQAETDASLSFELAEKVLRDRLRWLVVAGAGLKATTTAALADALKAAADSGQQGQAAGGTTAGPLRAPLVDILMPFPQHVLARLKGDHLPTLPDLILADQARLTRWCERYKAAMAAEAAATAAAAGAQMLAAAATPASPSAAAADHSTAGLMGQGVFHRTDEGPQGGPAAGTAAGLSSRRDTAATAAPAGPEEGSVAAAVPGGGVGVELQKAAAASGLPLDLLAAAVAADVQEQEAAAAAATKGEVAWRLLHDASLSVGKEQAVLLPELRKAVGGVLPALLVDSHSSISGALQALSGVDSSSASFDVAVLEVVGALEQHGRVLRTEILPALAESDSRPALRSLATTYRRAAATAPTRPHTWLLNTNIGSSSRGQGRAGRWVSAAVGAASSAVKVPVRAGVALADAAADAAHYGYRQTPLKT